MKKVFLVFSAFALGALLFVSCSKDDETTDLTSELLGIYQCERITLDDTVSNVKIEIKNSVENSNEVVMSIIDNDSILIFMANDIKKSDENSIIFNIPEQKESLSSEDISGDGDVVNNQINITLTTINGVLEYKGTKQ